VPPRVLPSFPTRRSSDLPVSSRFTAAEVANVVNHAAAETFFVASELAPLVETLRAEARLPLVRRFVAIGAEGDASLDALAAAEPDRKSTRLNSSHVAISY